MESGAPTASQMLQPSDSEDEAGGSSGQGARSSARTGSKCAGSPALYTSGGNGSDSGASQDSQGSPEL